MIPCFMYDEEYPYWRNRKQIIWNGKSPGRKKLLPCDPHATIRKAWKKRALGKS